MIHTTLSGNPLDRAADRRLDADWLAAARKSPRAVIAVFSKGRPLIKDNAVSFTANLLTPDDCRKLVVETGVLGNLNLFEFLFRNWPAVEAERAKAKPTAASASPPPPPVPPLASGPTKPRPRSWPAPPTPRSSGTPSSRSATLF